MLGSHLLATGRALWGAAAVLSVLMNTTYPWAAARAGAYRALEVCVATLFVAASIIGAMVHPLVLVVAVALHGVWDFAKHRGAGVPFFRWYTLGCLMFDIPWAGFLFLLWYTSG